MKKMLINGCYFEVTKSQLKSAREVVVNAGNDLYSYYNRPSRYKELIYKGWREWAYKTSGVSSFGVNSANSSTFTLTMFYTDEDTNQEYILYITKSHSRAIIL